jgi:hypothetical protein
LLNHARELLETDFGAVNLPTGGIGVDWRLESLPYSGSSIFCP